MQEEHKQLKEDHKHQFCDILPSPVQELGHLKLGYTACNDVGIT